MTNLYQYSDTQTNLFNTNFEIDIDNKFNYENSKPQHHDRTRKRLQVLIDMNCIDFGNQQFGIKHVVSGLYIEKVWSMSDEDFNDYVDWMKGIIIKKQKS